MTYTVNDCKRFYCKHYYGQCPHNRIARIDQDEVYCEDDIHIDSVGNEDIVLD